MNPPLDSDTNPPQFPGRAPGPGPHGHRQQYKFSSEELRVLKECNKDSFYQRCVPFGTMLGGATYLAVKNGILRSSARWGATPKVAVAVVVGYFLGKLSYQSKCAEKLMQLPNSHVGEMLRQRRRGNITESLEPGIGAGMALAPFSSMSPSQTYSDLSPYNSLDMDIARPDNQGLDDRQRPSMDNPIDDEEMPPVQEHVTTYEELRKKNREEYQQRRVGNYREPKVNVAPSQTPVQAQPQVPETDLGQKNRYGDVWG